MRHTILLTIIMLSHACGLGEDDRNAAGDDVPRKTHMLELSALARAGFADCQTLANDLAARASAAFALNVTAAEGRAGSAQEDTCDVTLSYEGEKAAEVLRFGDDDWSSDWLSPWQYSDAEACERDRSRQTELFAQHMQALVLADRCHTERRRQIPFQAYEIYAVVPVPQPVKVHAWEFPAELAPVWAKVTEEIQAHGAVVFRDVNADDNRLILAYAGTSAPVAHIARAAFNWYDGAFVDEADCNASLKRIDLSLKARFSGEALVTDCLASEQGFQPQMYYVSKSAVLTLMGTDPDEWYQTLAECDAAVPAADAAIPERVHFCMQETLGTRRFVTAYFQVP